MEIINDTRRKFTARYLSDLSKAVFAVALASKLFIELPTWLRILLGIGFVTLFILAFFIQPKGDKE